MKFLKFIPKDPIDNISTMVQVMAWQQTGDKPLPEPRLLKIYDVMGHH